ncbi:MAG: hemolysin III family protein [Clostridiales bacterium]|nr:hemolysin III family protein [Clostridiales bacterium]
MVAENTKPVFQLKDPGSAITHFIGLIASVFGSAPLLMKASGNPLHLISMIVFIYGLMFLYGASTIYHALNLPGQGNLILKRIDHFMIFILIACSYTPICLIVLPPAAGLPLLFLVWGIAITGILLKAFWINCPKWFSSILYISMGWVCILAFPSLLSSLSSGAFGWLLAGGLIYTAGGVIYAKKNPEFDAKHPNFGMHEIFHLFVMGGSFCHYIVMYFFIA